MRLIPSGLGPSSLLTLNEFETQKLSLSPLGCWISGWQLRTLMTQCYFFQGWGWEKMNQLGFVYLCFLPYYIDVMSTPSAVAAVHCPGPPHLVGRARQFGVTFLTTVSRGWLMWDSGDVWRPGPLDSRWHNSERPFVGAACETSWGLVANCPNLSPCPPCFLAFPSTCWLMKAFSQELPVHRSICQLMGEGCWSL